LQLLANELLVGVIVFN